MGVETPTGTCGSEHSLVKSKTLLQKMIWEFGSGCFLSGKDQDKDKSEHNKAWLLAESGAGCGSGDGGGAELISSNVDSQSVHSSFRFSLCSQVELDSLTASNSSSSSASSSATVLMVNLEDGFTESRSKELKWRRIESLERSISPVAHTLVRFSYAEILSATRNFSKGIQLGLVNLILSLITFALLGFH